jgi:hypothetical protein
MRRRIHHGLFLILDFFAVVVEAMLFILKLIESKRFDWDLPQLLHALPPFSSGNLRQESNNERARWNKVGTLGNVTRDLLHYPI